MGRGAKSIVDAQNITMNGANDNSSKHTQNCDYIYHKCIFSTDKKTKNKNRSQCCGDNM